ncbi:MAG: TetR/AcrR family transcriptional regulator [Methylotenera sp.]|nr:TetR/AcrR family transcriptional regulator [Methylotenera sp.]
MAQQANENTVLIEALFDIFRNHGYEGTTISLLSEGTGLQKSSLYHHFPAGKEDMLKAVVVYVSMQVHQHIITPLLDTQEKPEKRFSNMIATIKAFYSDGRKNCLLNVLNLGEAKVKIKELQNNDYNAWLNALIQLGKEVGMSQQEATEWSERFLIVVEGALVIQRLTGNKMIFDKQMEYEKNQFQQFLNQ